MINWYDVGVVLLMLLGVTMFNVTVMLYLCMALCVLIVWGCFSVCVFVLYNGWLVEGQLIVACAAALYFVVGYVLSRDWFNTVFGE